MKSVLKCFVFVSIVFLGSCGKELEEPKVPEEKAPEENTPEEKITVMKVGDKNIENYFDLDPGIIIISDCENKNYCLKSFDLNSDGLEDFAFAFSGDPAHKWLKLEFHNLSDYHLVCNSENELRFLTKSNYLHYNLNWQSGEKFLMRYSSPYSSMGEWIGGQIDGYVGFRKIVENDTIMGWMSVNSIPQEEGNGFIIKEYGLSK